MINLRSFAFIVFVTLACSWPSGAIEAQVVESRTFYSSLSVGLARAEDGLPFVNIAERGQWAPTARIGVGCRVAKFLAVELSGASMLSRLHVAGTRVADASPVEIDPLYASVVLQAEGIFPISERWEGLFGIGGGILLESARTKSPTAELSERESQIGYMVSVGARRGISDKLAAQIRFDFSDEYGGPTMWQGDLGCLSVGLVRSF